MNKYGVLSVLFLLLSQSVWGLYQIPQFDVKNLKLTDDFFPETARDVVIMGDGGIIEAKDFKLGNDFFPETARDVVINNDILNKQIQGDVRKSGVAWETSRTAHNIPRSNFLLRVVGILPSSNEITE